MFCTDEERDTCQCEKMGCDGCFYNNEKYNEKSFHNRIIEKFITKKLKKFLRFQGQPRFSISIKDIKIKDEFINTPPLERKMDRKWRFYRETGRLSSPIVLNEQFYLIDGYTSYLIAVADGIKTVEVEIRKEK